jgi:hypothetical protein
MVMGFLAVFLVMRCAVFPLAFDNVQSILSFAASAGEADNYSFSFYSVCDRNEANANPRTSFMGG